MPNGHATHTQTLPKLLPHTEPWFYRRIWDSTADGDVEGDATGIIVIKYRQRPLPLPRRIATDSCTNMPDESGGLELSDPSYGTSSSALGSSRRWSNITDLEQQVHLVSTHLTY